MINAILNLFERKLKNFSEERRDIIKFSLLVIFYEIPKILLIFLIGYFLGILQNVIITFILLAMYRVNSGGFHFKSNLGCLAWSSIMILGPAYILKNFSFEVNNELLFFIYAIVGMFSVFCVMKYAPADTKNAPIISIEIRKRKKLYSLIFVITFFISSLIFITYDISKILIAVMIIQSISITPIMYYISKCEYGKGGD